MIRVKSSAVYILFLQHTSFIGYRSGRHNLILPYPCEPVQLCLALSVNYPANRPTFADSRSEWIGMSCKIPVKSSTSKTVG
jgi:hypothetical protein